MPRLSFYEGAELFIQVKMGDSPIKLGRDDDNDIKLSDSEVSRLHAVIQPDDEQEVEEDEQSYYITDHSKNGTRLNAKSVTSPSKLTYGDRIYIGKYTIIFDQNDQNDKITKNHLSKNTTYIDLSQQDS